MKIRVALVEPEAALACKLEALLKGEGWAVESYPTLGRFFDGIARVPPNAVLLNMQLKGMEGREIMRALRANPETKVTLLIGLSSNERCKDEAVAAFAAGADEYFFRPLDLELLVVRLRSLITRKPAEPEEEVFAVGAVSVCPASHTCTVKGEKVRLTKLEFALLLQFMRNPQRVLTRGNLIDSLWRGDARTGGRAVDRHISSLRAKLDLDGRLLETVVGVGYRLVSGSSK